VAAVTACGSNAGQGDPSTEITLAKGAALHRADSCNDLLAQIQADAIAKLDESVELYKSPEYYRGGDGDGGVVGEPVPDAGDGDGDTGSSTDAGGESTGSDGSADPPPDKGDGDNASDGDGDGEAEGPSGHSETNTQVKDVDEADIVKIADGGERVFLIHGSEFKILKAWPAADTAEVGAAQVAGTPYELFVHEGKATVFSSVYPEDLPESQSKAGCWYGETFTQVSVFDVTGDTPQLEREMIFEGNYVSSRRNDDVVRVIVGGGFQGRDIFYPDVDRIDSFGREKSDDRLAADLKQWRDNVVSDIQNTTLKDWLPERFEKVDGEWTPIAEQCEGFYIPAPGLVESGITQVVTFEPAVDRAPHVVAVLGGTEIVYANNESLYLAQADYRWERFGQGDGQDDGPRTAVHKLELSAQGASYKASGFVPGVPLNQFSVDEADGVLRIATTINDWDSPVENRVFTLKGAEGQLSILDRSASLGEERETIKAVRFIGDRGYVVTFEQTDPLYALDLSDPSDIKVLGELHIPGFSEYIHPLGDDHLLTIGRNASQDGIALQIFDVQDPTSPTQDAVFNLEGYGYSEAEHNHKAFTFVDDYFEGGDDLLLFPLVTYGEQYRSSLEVFRISESEGFTQLGTIDHAQLINRDCPSFEQDGLPCYYYYGDEMRRGLQIDDYVYALSQGGLTVHDLEALAAGPVATVEFERPTWQGSRCYDGYYSGDGDYYEGGTSSTTSGDGDDTSITTSDSSTEISEPLPTMGGATNE